MSSDTRGASYSLTSTESSWRTNTQSFARPTTQGILLGLRAQHGGPQGDIDRVASICTMFEDLLREVNGLVVGMDYPWFELYGM